MFTGMQHHVDQNAAVQLAGDDAPPSGPPSSTLC